MTRYLFLPITLLALLPGCTPAVEAQDSEAAAASTQADTDDLPPEDPETKAEIELRSPVDLD